MLTVDAPLPGRRERDLRSGFSVPPELACRAWRRAAGAGLRQRRRGARAGGSRRSPGRTSRRWSRTASLPVLVKGVLTAEDARLAAEHGAAGVIVSNHGGRQLDGVPASVDALPRGGGGGGRAGRGVHGRRGAAGNRRGGRRSPSGPGRCWSGVRRCGAGGRGRGRSPPGARDLLRDELELALALCGCPAPGGGLAGARAARLRSVRRTASARPIVASDGRANSEGRVAAPRARRRGAVLGRLRERRLVDLLRARRGGELRARPDPDHVPDRRADLRLHRGDLHRGDGDVSGGRGVGELRPPCLQRGGQLHRRLGPDAQLHHHGRDLGLLRAPLPGGLLAGAAPRPGRRDRRHRPGRAAGGAQRQGDPGVLAGQPGAGDRRPLSPRSCWSRSGSRWC